MNSDAATARELAAAHSLEADIDGCLAGTALYLFAGGEGLELRERSEERSRGLRADFSAIDIRVGSGALSRNQPLARAIGKNCVSVFDSTAGLGHDAFLLACLGYDVTACERSAVIAALLADGLRSALRNPARARALGERLTIVRGDSRAELPRQIPAPDVVYLDPMFPPKKKSSAKAKKSIRWVRELVGADDDARELFEIACRVAVKRVVLKRPPHADPLRDPLQDLGRKPDLSLAGKLVRYEVYFAKPPQGPTPTSR